LPPRKEGACIRARGETRTDGERGAANARKRETRSGDIIPVGVMGAQRKARRGGGGAAMQVARAEIIKDIKSKIYEWNLLKTGQ